MLTHKKHARMVREKCCAGTDENTGIDTQRHTSQARSRPANRKRIVNASLHSPASRDRTRSFGAGLRRGESIWYLSLGPAYHRISAQRSGLDGVEPAFVHIKHAQKTFSSEYGIKRRKQHEPVDEIDDAFLSVRSILNP